MYLSVLIQDFSYINQQQKSTAQTDHAQEKHENLLQIKTSTPQSFSRHATYIKGTAKSTLYIMASYPFSNHPASALRTCG